MAARGFLGAGDLYINRIVAGVKQGLQGPYEAIKFEIKPNVDVKELVSKSRGNYGNVIESVALNQPGDFSIELAEVNKESMVLALLGTTSALSQGAAGSITAESIPDVALDVWIPVSKANLTGSQTVTHSSGSPTYVLGTDYLVNAQLGWVKFLSTGAVVAGDDPKITSTYGTTVGTRIAGGTQSELRAEFVLDGINLADRLPCIVRVHEGVIAADAAFDFLGDDFGTVSLPGKMKTPTGGTEPFTVDLRSA